MIFSVDLEISTNCKVELFIEWILNISWMETVSFYSTKVYLFHRFSYISVCLTNCKSLKFRQLRRTIFTIVPIYLFFYLPCPFWLSTTSYFLLFEATFDSLSFLFVLTLSYIYRNSCYPLLTLSSIWLVSVTFSKSSYVPEF